MLFALYRLSIKNEKSKRSKLLLLLLLCFLWEGHTLAMASGMT